MIVLQLTMHRRTESDCQLEVTLSNGGHDVISCTCSCSYSEPAASLPAMLAHSAHMWFLAHCVHC